MIALDTETTLIKSGEQIPELVCVSFANRMGESGVVVGADAKRTVFEALSSRHQLLFHNAPFDLAVFCRAYGRPMWDLVIKALEDGRIYDTMIAEKLLDNLIKGGMWNRYSLAKLVERRMGQELDKGDDGWRMRYGELIDVPIDQWPERAKSYAIKDAEVLIELHMDQATRAVRTKKDVFVPMAHECRAAFALYHVSAHGIITDPDTLWQKNTELSTELDDVNKSLLEWGLLSKKGTKNQKAIQALVAELHSDPPLTPGGAVSYGAEVLRQIDDPRCKAYVRRAEIEKMLSFVKALSVDGPIHPYINTLINTGRTSMSKPNLQQIPRIGGIREAIIPRPGNVFVDVDYSSAELRTWAQVCLHYGGYSAMAQLYQKDPYSDPYMAMAAKMMHISLDEALKLKAEKNEQALYARQNAKVAVLGYPGGMGAQTLMNSEHKKYWKSGGEQGSLLLFEDAAILKAYWMATFPEAEAHFERAAADKHRGLIKFTTGSGMYRGQPTFCNAANNEFQHLAAYGSKLSLWRLFKACWYEEDHPLYGCRPINFVHDQITIEAPVEAQVEAQVELEKIMVEEMQKATPNVPIVVEGDIKERWNK